MWIATVGTAIGQDRKVVSPLDDRKFKLFVIESNDWLERRLPELEKGNSNERLLFKQLRQFVATGLAIQLDGGTSKPSMVEQLRAEGKKAILQARETFATDSALIERIECMVATTNLMVDDDEAKQGLRDFYDKWKAKERKGAARGQGIKVESAVWRSPGGPILSGLNWDDGWADTILKLNVMPGVTKVTVNGDHTDLTGCRSKADIASRIVQRAEKDQFSTYLGIDRQLYRESGYIRASGFEFEGIPLSLGIAFEFAPGLVLKSRPKCTFDDSCQFYAPYVMTSAQFDCESSEIAARRFPIANKRLTASYAELLKDRKGTSATYRGKHINFDDRPDFFRIQSSDIDGMSLSIHTRSRLQDGQFIGGFFHSIGRDTEHLTRELKTLYESQARQAGQDR